MSKDIADNFSFAILAPMHFASFCRKELGNNNYNNSNNRNVVCFFLIEYWTNIIPLSLSKFPRLHTLVELPQ